MKLSKKAHCLLCDLEGLIDYARDNCLTFEKITKQIYDILSERSEVMTNRDIIEKLKSEVAEIELYDQVIPLGPKNDFMKHINKIFNLIDKIK